MRKGRQIFVAVLGIGVLGGLVEEHLARQAAERRYREAVEDRRRVELQFAEVRATHERLTSDLQKEQQRSGELTQALTSARAQLEQAVGRLTEEGRTVRELQQRLATMQHQMDQLQGELAIALQDREGSLNTGKASPVQLERVVVSDASMANFQGRILSVHRDWNFVVVNLGWNEVKLGETISIFRDEHLLAKARVERVQEGVCAATMLQEWANADIRVNDLVRVL